MTRIIRRNLFRDPAGRPFYSQSERVTDDGRGHVHQVTERTARACTGCNRPVVELSEVRGVCDWCHKRGCCVHCVSNCQVCSRRLCGHCRRGFAGPPNITVCAICQGRLIHRQTLQDHQAAFERELARHRLFNQDQSLRLNYERTHMTAYFEAVRLGLVRGPWWLRAIRGVWRAHTAVIQHAWRTLH